MIYLKQEIVQAVKKSIKISDHALQAYVKKSNSSADLFGIMLIRDNVISRNYIGKLIADCYNIAYIELSTTIYLSNICQLVPIELFLNLKSIPLYTIRNTITIATADPFNNTLKNKLSNLLNKDVNLLYSFSDEIGVYLYKMNNELLLEYKDKYNLALSASSLNNKKDILMFQLSNFLIRSNRYD